MSPKIPFCNGVTLSKTIASESLRVVLVLGARSEWGYVRPVYDELQRRGHQPMIWACNMAVSERYGNIVRDISKEGYHVTLTAQSAFDGGTSEGATKSLASVVHDASTWIANSDVDWVVLSGDRPEQFAFLIASSFAYIPSAHIQAGERSGNIDGLTRHAMARLAHVHFASNRDAADRLLRSGEESWRIVTTGAPQLDGLTENLFTREYLVSNELAPGENFVLGIFHSTTEELGKDTKHLDNILEALGRRGFPVVWISPNNDPGSQNIAKKLNDSLGRKDKLFINLSRNAFLSLMQHAMFMIGNSSSGLIEAPTFGLPSVNVGRRQKDRFRGPNVIDTEPTIDELNHAIDAAIRLRVEDSLESTNPYGDGKSSERIVDSLESLIGHRKRLVDKRITY